MSERSRSVVRRQFVRRLRPLLPHRLLLGLLLVVSISAAHRVVAENDPNQKRGFAPNQVYQVGEIDSVNVSNGNLLLRIPIGQEYAVGPTLRYQFVLTYNSKLWNYGYGIGGGAGVEPRFETPEKRSNAGFGWILSLGRLLVKDETTGGESFKYIAPDGGEFQFYYPTSQPGNLLYAYSGQYLRLRRLASGYEIDFPDGEIHTFDSAGNLNRMRDQFGNFVRIEGAATTQWTIVDGFGADARTHYVNFANVFDSNQEPRYPDHEHFNKRVVSVDLEAFTDGSCTTNCRRAIYAFQYDDDQFVSYGGDGETGPNPCVKGPLLKSITLPDNTKYQALFNTVPQERCGDSVLNGGTGTIRSLTLPTGGAIEWGHGPYRMNVHECTPQDVAFDHSYPGVTSRKFVGSDGRPVSTWIYKPHLVDSNLTYGGKICGSNDVILHGPAKEFFNIVEAPGGLVTKHHFSAWPTGAPQGSSSAGEPAGMFFGDELGLPFSRRSESGGRFLSTEVFDCSSGCQRDAYGTPTETTPIRRTYVSYAQVELWHNGAPWPLSAPHEIAKPWMVTGQRTEYEIDSQGGAAYYTDTAFSDPDHYGHFEKTVTKSNFTGSEKTRTSTVDRLQTIDSGKWLLAMYGESSHVDETSTTKTRAEFDLTTGFRQSLRTLVDASGETPSDLLTVWCRDPLVSGGPRGFVTSERYFGGDQALIPSGDLCGSGSPSPGHFRLVHTYDFNGARLTNHKAQWFGTSFPVADEEFDEQSGLVEKTRDSKGLVTEYKYDVLGRPTEVRPPAQAWTRYRYDRASVPSRVHVDVWGSAQSAPANSDSGSLKSEHHFYDGLGRLTLSKRRMPTGQWSAVRTTYDESGQVRTTSVPVLTNTSAFQDLSGGTVTTFWYDIFGRVTSADAPDGTKTLTEYLNQGTRQRTIVFREAGGSERDRSTEEYDGFGRLVKVTERSGTPTSSEPQGTDVSTSYTYDVADRRTGVATGVQERTFDYDDAGRLLEETHPESGQTHYTYDARGHVLTKQLGTSVSLRFEYDTAERLKLVRDSLQSDRPLQSFTYDSGLSPEGVAIHEPGRLVSQKRFNWLTPNANAYEVENIFEYDTAGRRKKKHTRIVSPTGAVDRFAQTFDYTELNEPASIRYPACSTCGAFATPERNLALTWNSGFLTEVAGAASMEYGPSGAVTKVQHETREESATGVLDSYTPDVTGSRPQRITFAGVSDCSLILTQPESVTVPAGQAASFTVTTAPGASVQWYEGVRPDTSTPRATGSSYTTEVLSSTRSYWARVTMAGSTCVEDSGTVQATVPIEAPSSLDARWDPSNSIFLLWTASTGAHHYEVERRSDGGAFVKIGTSETPDFTDATVLTSGKSYLYRVRGVDEDAGSASPYSNVDLATVMTFTYLDDNTEVGVAHLEQLRAGLNAVRTASGYEPLTWQAIVPSTVPVPSQDGEVWAAHIESLRLRLDDALALLGIGEGNYTDESLADVDVKHLHIEELRERIQ